MKALNQASLDKKYHDLETAYQATEKAIVNLMAQKETLRSRLNRIKLNQAALGNREVPDYPTWLRIKTA